MATLEQLSTAAAEALRDAEANKASTAAHFLRVQLPELFRLARHTPADRCISCEFHPTPTCESDRA